MPLDQSFDMPKDVTHSRSLRSSPLLIAAGACFAVAAIAATLPLRVGLAVVGVMLAVVCVAQLARRGLAKWQARSLSNVAIKMVSQDADNAFLTDQFCKVRYANAAAQAQFGASSGQLLHQVFEGILASPEGVVQRLRQQATVSGGGREDVVTRNGHFRLSISQIHDNCLLWRLDDLKEIQAGTARNGENIGLPLLRVSGKNTIVHANEALRKLVGGRPKELAHVFEDLPLRSGQTHTIMATTGRMRAIAAEIEGKTGERDIYVLPGAAKTQGPPQIGAGWDAIEDLPVPLLKISPGGTILASNREARQLLHVQDTDGRQVADMLDGLGRPINDWLREASDGRGGLISQFLRGRGDNQDTFVQVTLNTAGGVSDPHLIAVLNDVTELKTLEAQFVQSQKMQAIGQLAGGVAHDFNNLLTAISGHCDLLLLRHDEGDQNYGDLIQIHQNANRAASLVGQLLAFSRKQNLQPEVIDLRDTLSDLTHLLNRLVGEKVTLTLNHDPALAQIKADKRQLEQVLMNLVVNARDAMGGAGEIEVMTENMALKTQMVKDRAVVPPGEYVVVKVIDHGHGIPPEKLPKIFEPFFTTKRTGEGTGLGLSTAYGIVKQTGGYIFAESEVGEGTQFSLLFPSHDLPVADPIELPVEKPELSSSPADGVVLLVEDEAPVRAFASRALRLRGYTVLEADCAEAALELLADPQLSVDLFVTDVIMPGMDGPTWVRQALEKRPETKVVFVSGYAEDAFGDDKSRIPNSVFLPKPFSLNDLTQTVQAQLQDPALSA